MKFMQIATIILALAVAACQNSDGNKGKTRADRRQGQVNKKPQGKTDSLSGEGQQGCKLGEKSDLCRAIYVIVKPDGSFGGLDKEFFMSEIATHTFSPKDSKNQDTKSKNIEFSFINRAERKNSGVLMLVASSGLKKETKENIAKLQKSYEGENVKVKEVEIKSAADMDAMIAEAKAAQKNSAVVAFLVSHSILNQFQANKQASGLTFQAFHEAQLNFDQIENFLLKEYVGSLLQLHFTLPHRSEAIDEDSVVIKVADIPLKKGEEYILKTAAKQNVTLQLIKPAVFKKYSDELTIEYTLR